MTTLPLARRLSRGFATLLRPMQRRNAISTLATFNDRLLRDIGLSRADVDAMRRMW